MDNNKKILNKTQKVKKVRKPKVKKMKYDPSGGSRKNLILIVVAALAVIVMSSIIFMTLSSLFSTETYYVLNTNVKAKQEITPDMVVARETAVGTGPVNAIGMEHIQQGIVYSKYPLYAGDVIAESNAGPLSGSSVGIPDSWSVTSFSISSSDAVGGVLGRGDYVDVIGINEEGTRYIINNLLVLEVKFVNEEYDGRLDGRTVVGESMHYTVGMPADAVAYFHSALYDYDEIKLVKAPVLLDYADRDVSDLDDVFKYGPMIGNIDLFKGTDPTFTDVERDKDGKPLNYSEDEEEAIQKIENIGKNKDKGEKIEEDEVDLENQRALEKSNNNEGTE